MTNYFVRVTGSDAADGLTPATAWLTIGKALGAAGIASGDTVYLGAGTYRQVVTVAMTNPTGTTQIIGDVTGEHTGDAGEVIWSAALTNDETAASSSACVNLAGRDFLTFKNITFIGGTGTNQCINGQSTSDSLSITIEDCTFFGAGTSGQLVRFLWGANSVANFTARRCRFHAGQNSTGLYFQAVPHTARWDLGITVEHCLFVGGAGIALAKSGSNTFNPGGGVARYCTFIACDPAVDDNIAGWSPLTPFTVYGCVGYGCSASLNINSTVSTGYTLVGAGSVWMSNPATLAAVGGDWKDDNSFAPMLFGGQEELFGARYPMFQPRSGSNLAGHSRERVSTAYFQTFADDASVGTVAWTNPSNAQFSEDTRAVASAIPASTGISHYLKATNPTTFYPAIPASSTITGIIIFYERSSNNLTSIRENSIKLVIGGAISGTDQTDANNWTTTDAVRMAGGGANLWGTAPTAAQVQAADFGVVISAKNIHATVAADARIDHIRVYVFYTPPTSEDPTVDLLNRPRPAGGASLVPTIGSMEAHDTGAQELSVVRTGTAALILDGPGDHDFLLPVDAVLTTLSVWTRFDTNHGTTTRPQMQILNGGAIGVADATDTATGAVDTWEQLELAFTPTAKGYVTVRLRSRPAAANGKAYFDDFAVV